MSTYKILSLDGGGSWAILQAMALNDIYKNEVTGVAKCTDVLADFDLVVTNSGGSLVLAAILSRDNMQEVIDLFKNKTVRDKIFSKLSFWEKSFASHITNLKKLGPRYKTSRKIDGIRNVLGEFADTRLTDINEKKGITKPQYMVMTFDYDRNKATYFRSTRIDNKPNEVTLAQAVHASSNAPINYFDKPAEFMYQGKTRRYWDGAIGGNNNPCLVAVIEALALGYKSEDIKVLSIGTGNNLLPMNYFNTDPVDTYSFLKQDEKEQSLLNDIAKQASTILNEPPDVASYMAHVALGGNGNTGNTPKIVRMNALISPELKNGKWTLPVGFDPEIFKQLIALDMDAVENKEVELIEYLGNKWLNDGVKNQAIRANSDLECEIGFGKYSEAKNAW